MGRNVSIANGAFGKSAQGAFIKSAQGARGWSQVLSFVCVITDIDIPSTKASQYRCGGGFYIANCNETDKWAIKIDFYLIGLGSKAEGLYLAEGVASGATTTVDIHSCAGTPTRYKAVGGSTFCGGSLNKWHADNVASAVQGNVLVECYSNDDLTGFQLGEDVNFYFLG